MDQKLLIDATYAEEIRVVALEDGKLQEFDVEPSIGLQTIRNIYLARIEKIEPALQAAFVNYGADRHGFLPFRRIHPTYYKIPNKNDLAGEEDCSTKTASTTTEDESPLVEVRDEDPYSLALAGFNTYEQDLGGLGPASQSANGSAVEPTNETGKRRSRSKKYHRRFRDRRQQRIQDVIRPGQVLIVQVKKDELDEKGASLTTYISLAGHYCVLLPNTDKGCILSSKISSEKNRHRLQQIYNGLDLRRGAAMIMRTAGCNQKEETIQREYNSLVKMWNDIMRRAREAVAPAPLYVDGNLIDRSLRDVFKSSGGVIHVDGEEGYQRAVAYLKREIPEAVDRVKLHGGQTPLFVKHKVDQEIRHLTHSEVPLRSGGRIVIQNTEAMVSIDVNSGRATDKHTLRETALQTNIEAADEIARQLQLRDLAGLIVIDFIDMDEARHRSTVEKRFRAAVKRTRGRSRVGFITSFGLLEMTRQRLGRDYYGGSTTVCSKCHGTGRVLLDKPFAISVLRHIEAECSSRRTGKIEANVPVEVANCIHNELRHHLERIEDRFQSKLVVRGVAVLNTPEYAFVVCGPFSNKSIFEYSSIAGQSEDGELDLRTSRLSSRSEAWKGRRRGRNGSLPLPAPLIYGSETHGALPVQEEGVGEQPDALNVLEIERGGHQRRSDGAPRSAKHSEGKKRKRTGKRGGRGRKRKAASRENGKVRLSSTELKAGIRNGDIETNDRSSSKETKKKKRVKNLRPQDMNGGKPDQASEPTADIRPSNNAPSGAKALAGRQAKKDRSQPSRTGRPQTDKADSHSPKDSVALDARQSAKSGGKPKRAKKSKGARKVGKTVSLDVAKATTTDKIEDTRVPVDDTSPQQGLATPETEPDSQGSSQQSPPDSTRPDEAASSGAASARKSCARGSVEQKEIREPDADSGDAATTGEVKARGLPEKEPIHSARASTQVQEVGPGPNQDSASSHLPDNSAERPEKPSPAKLAKKKKAVSADGPASPSQAKKAGNRKNPAKKTRAGTGRKSDPGTEERKPDRLSRELDRMYPPELQIIPDEFDRLAPILPEVPNG